MIKGAEVADKIKVMISSTTKDLSEERKVIFSILSQNSIFGISGSAPFNDHANSMSSFLLTKKMASECDLYILLLGKCFGWDIGDGRSATEIEFDAAIKEDPTKILIFLKQVDEIEPKQKKFIEKVTSYYSGYWRVEFDNKIQLESLVKESILAWLKDRASLNHKVSCYEHFIREAIQLKPTPETEVYYSVRKNFIEIEYHAMNETHCIQYERKDIYNDFWNSLHEVENNIRRWSETWK